MKAKIFIFLMLTFVSNVALANSVYEVKVTFINKMSNLVFPTFKVSSLNPSGVSQVNNCTYMGKLIEQGQVSILIEGQLLCIEDGGESYIDLPLQAFRSEGGSASMEIGSDNADAWKYTLKVNALH